MTFDEVYKSISGLSAYDNGCIDSGIRDETLRARLKVYVHSLSTDERRLMLSRVLRELFLSDEALSQGYGWEDAQSLCRWFEDQFGVG